MAGGLQRGQGSVNERLADLLTQLTGPYFGTSTAPIFPRRNQVNACLLVDRALTSGRPCVPSVLLCVQGRQTVLTANLRYLG